MKNILILVALFFAGCGVRWGAEDQRFMEKNCRGDSCYMGFTKTPSAKDICSSPTPPIDCMNKEDPNKDGGGTRPGNGTGGNDDNTTEGDPCTSGRDCPGDVTGDPLDPEKDPGTPPPKGSGGALQGVGDVLSHWSGEIGNGWDAVKSELNGSNAEGRRKKREAKRIMSEIKDLWAQAQTWGQSIDNDKAGIEGDWGQLNEAAKEFGLASRDKDIAEFQGRYNLKTKGVLDGVPTPAPSVFDGLGKGRGDGIYPEHAKVESGRKYLKYARGKLDPNSVDYAIRKTLVDIGDAVMDEAESSYRGGNVQEGNAWYEFGMAAADMALSLTPGVGWAKDCYEAWTGNNLLTGKPLTKIEQTMAYVSAFSGGMAKVGSIAKAAKIAGFLGKGAKTAEEVEAVAKIGENAVEIAESAAKAGVKDKAIIDEVAEAVKDGLPCVAFNTPQPLIFRLFVDTAYAGDCIPGSAEKLVKESFGNTKLSAAEFEEKLSKLPPGEKVAEAKGTLTAKARERGWTKDRNVTKKNSREVYSDGDGNYWAFDTRHGRYEKCNARGKHQGEFNIDLDFQKDSIDTSGGHDLIF